MRVLVSVASKHGATAEIADAIAEELGAADLEAVRCEPGEVSSLDRMDAAVIGSAVYAGRWLEPARRLVEMYSQSGPSGCSRQDPSGYRRSPMKSLATPCWPARSARGNTGRFPGGSTGGASALQNAPSSQGCASPTVTFGTSRMLARGRGPSRPISSEPVTRWEGIPRPNSVRHLPPPSPRSP